VPIHNDIFIDADTGIERAVPEFVEQDFTDAVEVTVPHPYARRRPRIDVYFGNDAVMPETRIAYRGPVDDVSDSAIVVRFHSPESGMVVVRR